jgi:hypothetical protein
VNLITEVVNRKDYSNTYVCWNTNDSVSIVSRLTDWPTGVWLFDARQGQSFPFAKRSRQVLDKLKRNSCRDLDRPPRVQRGRVSQISWQSAHEGGKVVSLMHRPPLPPRKYSWYSFGCWVDPRTIMQREGLCLWKIPTQPPAKLVPGRLATGGKSVVEFSWLLASIQHSG